MIDSAGYLTCLLAVLGGLSRLRPGRRAGSHRREPALVAGFAFCMGASAALLAPASAAAVQGWPMLHRALPLIGLECRFAAECLLAVMAYTVQAAGNARARVSRQTVGSALAMAAAAGLYLAADAGPVAGRLTAGPGGRAPLAAYNVLFTLHSAWCAGLFAVVIRRAVRHVGPGLLRVGLRLVAAAGAAGLVWTALSVIPLADQLSTGRQDTAEDVYSAPVAVLCLTLGIGGATLTAWAGRAVAPLRWLRAWRSYRRIGPLWSALHAARPEIALEPSAPWWSRGGAGRNAEFALYRRVIEIRDGQLALRAYVHPSTARWAGEAGPGPDGTGCSAVVEAATVAAALEAAAVDRRFGGAAFPAPGPRPDLAAEAAWLELVAEAFTGSARVARVRRRVRAELRR
ncbi:MAB_1171c family putative transporter [Kitasatospora sp. NPDC050543]|uniref:MAB_1171c family putative transporter n=1 Tax=Kitasatospora sp. NPDC050543 TaxID=3364054 RepID=UPI0037AA9F8C